MAQSKSESNVSGDWITPSGFEALREQHVSFESGGTRFAVSALQLHVHRIDSVTHAHSHGEYQILYYLSGRGEQVIAQERHPVAAQTVFFIPPRKSHFFLPEPGGEAEVLALRFSIEMDATCGVSDSESREFRKLARLLYGEQLRRIELGDDARREAGDVLKSLQEEIALQRFGYTLAIKGYLLLLLRLFLRESLGGESEEPPLTRAQLLFLQATHHIRRNVQEALTLGDLATTLHVSTSYLQKLFRSMLAKPFTRYVQETKMNHAAHLLRATDLTVKEIAAECGIPDRHYFTRLFRKVHGVSPRRYRKHEMD